MDNVLDAIPKEKHDEVRPKLNRIFYGATSLERAKEALQAFKREYAKIYPSAIGRLESWTAPLDWRVGQPRIMTG